MTYNELLDEVYTLTNRPDLVAETKTAVKAATLKAHHSDFYSKDIIEELLAIGSPAYIVDIDFLATLTNFRAIKYIRKWDVATSEAGDFIEVLEPEEVLDAYGDTKADVAYVAGSSIKVRSSTEISNLIIGYYTTPIVTDSGYSSWVATMYPYVIVFEAARVVFKTIGYDEQSATYERLVAEQYATFRLSALSDVGY
jgi:hypothetical protein